MTRDGETHVVQTNESNHIPLGIKHRPENPGGTPLPIIEVQYGDYLEEDDIERFSDNYGRNNPRTSKWSD